MPGLDGLRGVAVAGVVLYHLGYLTGGYLGVDAFFVLSGFLITSLLVHEWGRGRGIGLRAFWARRARRLLPALFGVLLGVAVYAVLFADPTLLDQIRGDAYATLAYVANWRSVWSGQSYFTQFTAPSPLEHTWSLAIEEQFYVIWPLVFLGVMTLRRGSLRALFTVTLALALASQLWMIVRYSPNGDPSRVYFGTDTRAGSILLGAALAVWIAWKGPARSHASRRALELGGWVAIGVLALAWTRLGGESDWLYRGGFLVCAVAVAAVIAAAAHPEVGGISRLLSVRPLAALGLISYGVYLWHWPIDLALTPGRVGFGGVPLDVVRIAATLVIATLSFVLVERPIRQGALRRLTLWTWVPAGATACAVAVFASTVGAVPAPTAGRPAVTASSHGPGVDRRLLLLGDSVAGSLASGLVEHHTPWSVTVVDGSHQGCGYVPTSDVVRDIAGNPLHGRFKRIMSGYRKINCDVDWKHAVATLRPVAVVIALGTDDYLRLRDGPCTSTYVHAYTSRLTSDVAAIEAKGVRVVVATIAYPRPDFTRLVDEQGTYRRVDCENGLIRNVAAVTHAGVLDLGSMVCAHGPGTCITTFGHAVVRWDGIHYTAGGVAMFAPRLLTLALGPPTS